MPNPPEEDSADLELRALEHMISARCEQIERCTEAAAAGASLSRESDLQLQAFAERRAMARRELGALTSEPAEIRIARLESIVRALECSWDYFRSRRRASVDVSDDMSHWGVCVR